MPSIPFSVLTFNIMKFGSRVPPRTVLDRLFALEPRPDLIGFQEVFNTALPGFFRNARKILAEALEERGYKASFVRTSGLPMALFRDGLMLAYRQDKWAPAAFDQEPLGTGSSGRHVQFAALESRETGQRVAFFNTHLSFGRKPKHHATRVRQGGRVRDFIERMEAEHRPVASVLTGDFNEPPVRLDKVLSGLLKNGFSDTFSNAPNAGRQELRVTYDLENTIVRRKASKHEASRRIDYVLLRSGEIARREPAVEAEASRIVLAEVEEDVQVRRAIFDANRRPVWITELGENLSDHYGVLTEFSLHRNGGS